MIDELTGEIIGISEVTPPAQSKFPDFTRMTSLMEDFKSSLTVMNSKLDAVTRKVEILSQAKNTNVIHAPQPSHPIRVQTPPRPKSVTFTSDTVFDRPPSRQDSVLSYADDDELDYSAETPPAPPPQQRPLHPQTRPASPNLARGTEYFSTLSDTVKDLTILWWAKVISWGNWGAMTERGPEKIAGNSKYEEKRAFVKRAIQRAFTSGSYYCFLLPPSCSVGSSRTQSTKLYGWANAVYRGYGTLPPNYETPPGDFCEPPSQQEYYSDTHSGPETHPQLRMIDNRSPSGPFSHMPDPFRETSVYTTLGEGIYGAPCQNRPRQQAY